MHWFCRAKSHVGFKSRWGVWGPLDLLFCFSVLNFSSTGASPVPFAGCEVILPWWVLWLGLLLLCCYEGLNPGPHPCMLGQPFPSPQGWGAEWTIRLVHEWEKMLDIHYLLDAFLWAGTQVVRTFRLYLRVRDWEGQSYAFNIFPKYSSFHTQRLDFSFKNYVKAVLTISFVQMLDIKQS